ncbi:Uncharacterised protein [Vibrio cholerae]|nr:Uncharacterised protein [Vibrio cholerae]
MINKPSVASTQRRAMDFRILFSWIHSRADSESVTA